MMKKFQELDFSLRQTVLRLPKIALFWGFYSTVRELLHQKGRRFVCISDEEVGTVILTLCHLQEDFNICSL